LRSFYKKIQPGGPGWSKIVKEAKIDNEELVLNSNKKWSVPSGIKAMILGCFLIYSCMFATGYWIYGDLDYAIPITLVAIISGYFLSKEWNKIKDSVL